ncbi:serine protease [Mycobacterium sp. M1]|uniref:Serine protease n=1 Tax=Mycolicibacter acidiphilus TaxID=2835306 RepID=A0ABS5RKT0_9MYCO|nr:serine protease [Mycolicibacter acidiphilus]MBS9534779.1 serine protease [Mycolicibacter acidiphilus]
MFTVAAAATLALAGSGAVPTATADGGVVIGGGAAILVNNTTCTLGAIGTDRAGDVVGLTSTACGGPGSPVAAGWQPGTLGTVVAVEPSLDYAVIKFDAAKVAPTSDFAGFAINGVGPDATYFQWACRDSQRNGIKCMRVSTAGVDPDTVVIHACGNPADSGAPVTVDNLLVGMTRGYFPDDTRCPVWDTTMIGDQIMGDWEVPQRDKPEVTSINAVLADLNAKGGPGAGFTLTPPVPAPNR